MDKNKLRREYMIQQIQERSQNKEFAEEAIQMIYKYFGDKEGMLLQFRPRRTNV